MNELPIIELERLNQSITTRDSFQELFSIVDVNGEFEAQYAHSPERFLPMRLDALLMILTFEGTFEIKLDYVSYIVRPNSFVIIMPMHASQFCSISKDFKGRLLIASKEFLDDCKMNGFNRPRDITNYMEARKHPYSELTPEETLKLDGCLQIIREKIRETSHVYHKELVQNAFIGFLLDLGNIMYSKRESVTRSALSRKEELFEQFLALLFAHCKEQHEVSFYAEKLFITPQYLSLILKKLTGKSANKWIDDALIVEAKILLRAPQATVQQVADQLHFSDQSTFGKFFKKHMGKSPMEYRKTKIVTLTSN
ncbi:MAG: helix-turn-helix transcriptional regulator [Parabacteroides sp.]|nr:helix-turn-helix transcriptional regulator [Parabacteroides sp.]